MPELSVTRHDLPPRWDGWPVTWQGWGWFTGILCRHSTGGTPRHDVCAKCGHVGEQPMNRGHAQPERYNGRRILLLAFRCPHCRHDIVYQGFQCWDLEAADYLDPGSQPP